MFTRKLIRGTVMGLTALVALAGMPKNSSAQEVLKFGHVYEVDTPYHRAALKASELFAERTDGRYKIEVFPASQLGKEAAINEAPTRQEGVGRKLEFITQEMGREVNTIGSKANDSEISARVVEMKTSLERVREQVQNVE